MAIFKFYSPNKEDSLKLHYTFSNLGDLQEQLYLFMGAIKLCIKGGVNEYGID